MHTYMKVYFSCSPSRLIFISVTPITSVQLKERGSLNFIDSIVSLEYIATEGVSRIIYFVVVPSSINTHFVVYIIIMCSVKQDEEQ